MRPSLKDQTPCGRCPQGVRNRRHLSRSSPRSSRMERVTARARMGGAPFSKTRPRMREGRCRKAGACETSSPMTFTLDESRGDSDIERRRHDPQNDASLGLVPEQHDSGEPAATKDHQGRRCVLAPPARRVRAVHPRSVRRGQLASAASRDQEVVPAQLAREEAGRRCRRTQTGGVAPPPLASPARVDRSGFLMEEGRET